MARQLVPSTSTTAVSVGLHSLQRLGSIDGDLRKEQWGTDSRVMGGQVSNDACGERKLGLCGPTDPFAQIAE